MAGKTPTALKIIIEKGTIIRKMNSKWRHFFRDEEKRKERNMIILYVAVTLRTPC